VASNTFWALSVEVTSCHPSAAQNIKVALWFLKKKIVCPGYTEHLFEQSALETAGTFGGDGSIVGVG
jgi:hypothetical protein